jgi:hypothetical protein
MLNINDEITPIISRKIPSIREDEHISRFAPKSRKTESNDTFILGSNDTYKAALFSVTGSFVKGIGHNDLTPSQPVWLIVRSQNKENDAIQEDSQEIDKEVRTVNSDRLYLLAKKYAMKELPKEDEARLLILQEKISNIFPRVDNEDYKKIDEIAEKVKMMDQKDEEIRLKLAQLG